MNKKLANYCLRWLRIEPLSPDLEQDGHTIVVRMTRRIFYYNLANWLVKQAAAFFFLIAFFNLGWFLENMNPFGIFTFVELGERFQDGVFEFLSRNVYDAETWFVNPFSANAVRIYEWVGIGLFLLQAVISFIPVWLRLPYHATWYNIESDRIRAFSGLWTRREQTTRYANIQALNLKRNPFQTILGISTIELRTAGGGGKGKEEAEKEDSNRILRLKNIENGSKIAERIRQRMLDPEPRPNVRPDMLPPEQPAVLVAAESLLAEAKALREAARS